MDMAVTVAGARLGVIGGRSELRLPPRSETRFVRVGDERRRADGDASRVTRISRRAAVVEVVPALVAVGAELALLLDDGSASAAAIALTVISGSALALRRAQPIMVLAVTLAAAIGIVAIGETPAGLIQLIALSTVASASMIGVWA